MIYFETSSKWKSVRDEERERLGERNLSRDSGRRAALAETEEAREEPDSVVTGVDATGEEEYEETAEEAGAGAVAMRPSGTSYTTLGPWRMSKTA